MSLHDRRHDRQPEARPGTPGGIGRPARSARTAARAEPGRAGPFVADASAARCAAVARSSTCTVPRPVRARARCRSGCRATRRSASSSPLTVPVEHRDLDPPPVHLAGHLTHDLLQRTGAGSGDPGTLPLQHQQVIDQPGQPDGVALQIAAAARRRRRAGRRTRRCRAAWSPASAARARHRPESAARSRERSSECQHPVEHPGQLADLLGRRAPEPAPAARRRLRHRAAAATGRPCARSPRPRRRACAAASDPAGSAPGGQRRQQRHDGPGQRQHEPEVIGSCRRCPWCRRPPAPRHRPQARPSRGRSARHTAGTAGPLSVDVLVAGRPASRALRGQRVLRQQPGPQRQRARHDPAARRRSPRRRSGARRPASRAPPGRSAPPARRRPAGPPPARAPQRRVQRAAQLMADEQQSSPP